MRLLVSAVVGLALMLGATGCTEFSNEAEGVLNNGTKSKDRAEEMSAELDNRAMSDEW